MDFLKKLEHGYNGQPESSSKPQEPAAQHHGILDKLNDALSSSQGAQQHATGGEGLLGKIGGAHHSQQAPAQQGGGLLGKISSLHRPEPAQDPQSGGLMGKLNNALGGGHAGEQKEDALDKAVDFVQEHIFHAGPQNNESALEQMKDKQIADTIRGQFKHLTGK